MENGEDRQLRDEVVAWLRDHLPPDWVRGIEEDDPELVHRGRAALDHQRFLEDIGASGWAQPTWPAEYGGKGLEPAQARVVEEVKARYRVPRSFNVIGLGMGAPTILQWGSDEVKKRFLPPMVQHREIWTCCGLLQTRLTPSSGSWSCGARSCQSINGQPDQP